MLVCTENITKKKIFISLFSFKIQIVSLCDPYHANIFCPENVVCFLHPLHSLMFTSD